MRTSSPAGFTPPSTQRTRSVNAVTSSVGSEVAVPDAADRSLHDAVRKARRGDPVCVDLLHRERDEQVAEVVQRQDRDGRRPVHDRDVRHAVLDPARRGLRHAQHGGVERLLGGAECRIRVELVDGVGVVDDDAGRAGNLAVQRSELEEERRPCGPGRVEERSVTARAQLRQRLEVLPSRRQSVRPGRPRVLVICGTAAVVHCTGSGGKVVGTPARAAATRL